MKLNVDRTRQLNDAGQALHEAANKLEDLARYELGTHGPESVNLYAVARLVNKSLALRSYAHRIDKLNY